MSYYFGNRTSTFLFIFSTANNPFGRVNLLKLAVCCFNLCISSFLWSFSAFQLLLCIFSFFFFYINNLWEFFLFSFFQQFLEGWPVAMLLSEGQRRVNHFAGFTLYNILFLLKSTKLKKLNQRTYIATFKISRFNLDWKNTSSSYKVFFIRLCSSFWINHFLQPMALHILH